MLCSCSSQLIPIIPVLIITLAVHTNSSTNDDKDNQFNLPASHLPFYYSSRSRNEQRTETDKTTMTTTPFKAADVLTESYVCWGFEDGCDFKSPGAYSYPNPVCDADADADAGNADFQYHGIANRYAFDQAPSTVERLRDLYFQQADFGYISTFRDSVKTICEPFHQDSASESVSQQSQLECSEQFTFCRGRNILLNFVQLGNRTQPIMYDTDVLSAGGIRGSCRLNQTLMEANSQFESSLSSWTSEIKHFRGEEEGSGQSGQPGVWMEEQCDVIVDRPTIIMKLDATSNMYHHFCDFFNLYATLFVNSSRHTGGGGGHDMFDQNVNILFWRSWYSSNFGLTFNAFTRHRLLDLKEYFGQKVCFRNVVFSLLPRMLSGLYYSTPVEPGCRGSGLFNAFSEFLLHRLQIPSHQSEPNLTRLRVTILSRQTTFRKILNEDAIMERLRKNIRSLEITKVVFSGDVNFLQQLTLIRNTDILIGMHGAGLTHMLFLPKWAVVFEVYHCEDPNCYSELARLCGLKYITWTRPDKMTVKEVSATLDVPEYFHKHANYEFDAQEFERLVSTAVTHITNIHSVHVFPEDEHDEL